MNSKRYITQIFAGGLCLLTSACVDMSHSEVGRIFGAIGGAVIGSEVSGGDRDAMIIGGLLGSYVGGKIGQELDEQDTMYMSEVVFFVLDHGADGYSKSWRNGRNRHYGHFSVHSTYRTSGNVKCRRFTNTIYVSKHPRRSAGTACRHPRGTWSIIR
jgi:surface antigen